MTAAARKPRKLPPTSVQSPDSLERDKQMYDLRYVDKWKLREIGDHYGVVPSVVRNRTERERKRRGILTPEERLQQIALIIERAGDTSYNIISPEEVNRVYQLAIGL